MNNREQNKQYLILVDDLDRQWGKLEKMEVHQLGLLHRAFSVFIFNSNGEMLLQQRSDEKYHSGGLWTNACCSHPHYGEDTQEAVRRRLFEEMGMIAEPQFAFSFIYKVQFANGLIENEFDHVYIGISDAIPQPDPKEVKSWKYMPVNEIVNEMESNPERYTHWFRICFDRSIACHQQSFAMTYGI